MACLGEGGSNDKRRRKGTGARGALMQGERLPAGSVCLDARTGYRIFFYHRGLHPFVWVTRAGCARRRERNA